MPNVRDVDRSDVYKTDGWLPPPSLPVCEHAPILDRRTDSGWPFLYSYREGGRCVVNTAPRKSKYAQAEEVGMALI